MNSQSDAGDKEVRAFIKLSNGDSSHEKRFRRIQQVIREEKWPLLSELILKTACVQEGLLCFWPRGFRLSLDVEERSDVRERWETGIKTMLATFNRLSDQEKAARISQAEELKEHDFLAFLTLETDCVLNGFINDFPKLLASSQKNAFISWRKQRALAVKRFKKSSKEERLKCQQERLKCNRERLECLNRIVSLQLRRALSDLVRIRRIGRLGFPGEMPDFVSPEGETYSRWESHIAQAVNEFGNLPPDQKGMRLAEALTFQQTRFIRELLRVSMDGFGQFADWMPSTVLKDDDIDAKWMRLRLPELVKSSHSGVARIHTMQKLRSEPLDHEVAGRLGIRNENDPSLLAAWKQGWMAFLRSQSVPFDRIPAALANDPEVVLGAWREGLGKYDPVDVLGVDDGRRCRVFDRLEDRANPSGDDSQVGGKVADTVGDVAVSDIVVPRKEKLIADDRGAVKVLGIAVHLGTLEEEWREGGVADRLETREAWAWAWRRHLLLSPNEMYKEPPLQLRNIPQILEAWAMRAISNVNSEYTLDEEHGMPFPAFQNVTLLNRGLLDCWAHAWSQFARRNAKPLKNNADPDKLRPHPLNEVPCKLRSHPLIETLCQEKLVQLPEDITKRLEHNDERERSIGRKDLLKELRRTPIPFALIPEHLSGDRDVRSAWSQGWESCIRREALALPREWIPAELLGDQSVIRAWKNAWKKAIQKELVPWHCLPDWVKEDEATRLAVIEKWLGLACEQNWISSPVPDDVAEKESLFFRWTEAWYLLPQKREFSVPDSLTSYGQKFWIPFLRSHPVAPNEISQVWRDSEEVMSAWREGWVRALKLNAVHQDKIPEDILPDLTVFDAFRAGWVRKMRFEPLSLWELPPKLREESLVVDALVQGWTRRIAALSDEDLWDLPRRAWLNPLTESKPSDSAPTAETDISNVSWNMRHRPPLWVAADEKIKEALRKKCAELYSGRDEELKLRAEHRFGL
jgi:hypothetical protein